MDDLTNPYQSPQSPTDARLVADSRGHIPATAWNIFSGACFLLVGSVAICASLAIVATSVRLGPPADEFVNQVIVIVCLLLSGGAFLLFSALRRFRGRRVPVEEI